MPDQTIFELSHIRYQETGKGEPMLLLHGLLGNLNNFASVYSFFAEKGYRVIVAELPFFAVDESACFIKEMAKILLDFLAEKGMNKVIVVGNSLGGHIALHMALLQPERIKAVVLTGSSGLLTKNQHAHFPRRRDRDYLEERVKEVFFDPGQVQQDWVDEIVHILNDREKAIRIVRISKSAFSDNLEELLPSVSQPVCLIWGKNDMITPLEMAETFARSLKNVDFYCIDACGHVPMMEKAAEFNQILFNWLQNLRLVGK